MVTPAVRAMARPLSVVTTAVGGLPPVVDIVIALSLNIVPVMVDPVPITAPAGTYQNTFLACAPLINCTCTGTAGVAGPVRPTLRVPVPAAVWKIQTALASPLPSNTRLPEVLPGPPMS